MSDIKRELITSAVLVLMALSFCAEVTTAAIDERAIREDADAAAIQWAREQAPEQLSRIKCHVVSPDGFAVYVHCSILGVR